MDTPAFNVLSLCSGGGGSISASEWRSRLLAQSASLRGRPTAAKSWLRGWKTVSWLTHLFGRIYEPSTASRGAASWIASLAATRASRSPGPGSASGTETSDTCGLISPASSEKSGPSGASSKTSGITYVWALSRSTTTYHKWVTRLRRVCLQRQKSAPRTGENGCSLLPTPTSRDHKGRSGAGRQRRKGNPSDTLPNAIGGVPNPVFVEWMMGLPAGWTACGPAATALSPLRPHSRGER